MNTLTKYLDHYGEIESKHLNCPVPPVQHVLVVPAFKESLSQLEQVWSSLTNLIVVLVVNSSNSNDAVTRQLLADIKQHWQLLSKDGNHAWYQYEQQVILVVDRCSEPIPLKQGVGKARKIGADIAARLIHNGDVTTPWIMTTDADAILPADYFDCVSSLQKDTAFVIYPFRHHLDNGDLGAGAQAHSSACSSACSSALYEFSLLWYAYGLKYAGSAYAYPTVGSTIGCHVEAYAKVRGFPQRSAGEDFYLLNKLRKIGTCTILIGQPIQLSSRQSDRVPFGTGPGIKAIQALPEPLTDHLFYHPECFISLKAFLHKLTQCQVAAQNPTSLKHHFNNALHWQFVAEQKLDQLMYDKHGQTEAVFQKFLFDWFDGFKTLKFVHHIRDQQYASVNFQALWGSELLPSELLPSELLTSGPSSTTRFSGEATKMPMSGINPADIQTLTEKLWRMLD